MSRQHVSTRYLELDENDAFAAIKFAPLPDAYEVDGAGEARHHIGDDDLTADWPEPAFLEGGDDAQGVPEQRADSLEYKALNLFVDESPEGEDARLAVFSAPASPIGMEDIAAATANASHEWIPPSSASAAAASSASTTGCAGGCTSCCNRVGSATPLPAGMADRPSPISSPMSTGSDLSATATPVRAAPPKRRGKRSYCTIDVPMDPAEYDASAIAATAKRPHPEEGAASIASVAAFADELDAAVPARLEHAGTCLRVGCEGGCASIDSGDGTGGASPTPVDVSARCGDAAHPDFSWDNTNSAGDHYFAGADYLSMHGTHMSAEPGKRLMAKRRRYTITFDARGAAHRDVAPGAEILYTPDCMHALYCNATTWMTIVLPIDKQMREDVFSKMDLPFCEGIARVMTTLQSLVMGRVHMEQIEHALTALTLFREKSRRIGRAINQITPTAAHLLPVGPTRIVEYWLVEAQRAFEARTAEPFIDGYKFVVHSMLTSWTHGVFLGIAEPEEMRRASIISHVVFAIMFNTAVLPRRIEPAKGLSLPYTAMPMRSVATRYHRLIARAIKNEDPDATVPTLTAVIDAVSRAHSWVRSLAAWNGSNIPVSSAETERSTNTDMADMVATTALITLCDKLHALETVEDKFAPHPHPADRPKPLSIGDALSFFTAPAKSMCFRSGAIIQLADRPPHAMGHYRDTFEMFATRVACRADGAAAFAEMDKLLDSLKVFSVTSASHVLCNVLRPVVAKLAPHDELARGDPMSCIVGHLTNALTEATAKRAAA